MTKEEIDWLTPLLEEHRSITQDLELIRKEITMSRLKSSERLPKLIDGLGLRIAKHFMHEEQTLYRQLKARLKEDSPTEEMIMDHESMRVEFEVLRHSCVVYESGHGSIVALRRSIDSLQGKLSEHMKKEERVLFWLADVKLNQ